MQELSAKTGSLKEPRSTISEGAARVRSTAYVMLVAAFAGGLAGCSEEFIDKDPIVGETIENFYRNEEDALAAVNAAYAALQFELSPAGHFRWFWGDIMSDDAVKGGSGDNDVFELKLLEEFQGPTNTDLLEGEWSADYELIYRANVVLAEVPDVDMDERLRARILAEARFLRAYGHYTLVTMFGDVPLVDKVLAPSEYNRARAPATEVWAAIEADLLAAIPDLYLRSEYGEGDLGRVTRGAARAVLAKAYLWQGRDADARQQTAAIIESGEYRLADSYAGIFTEGGENGPGSVFEIQYMNASGGNWGRNNANEGTFTNVFQRPRGAFDGFGFNIPTQDFVDAFFAEGYEDPRLRHTVLREGDRAADRGVFTTEATGTPFRYHPRKYLNPRSEEAPFGDPAPNGGSNDRVLRYADVLLLHAEASAKTGDDAAAREALNQVRRRARNGVTGTDVLPDVTASGNELLAAVYRERRLELGLEGHRFFDLVRTGRAAEVLGPLGYREGVHRVFPIPQSQVQLSQGVLTQNPGY